MEFIERVWRYREAINDGFVNKTDDESSFQCMTHPDDNTQHQFIAYRGCKKDMELFLHVNIKKIWVNNMEPKISSCFYRTIGESEMINYLDTVFNETEVWA